MDDRPTGEGLVGREHELERLLESVAVGHSVALVGEAGIGKTALVSVAAATIDRRFRRVLWVRTGAVEREGPLAAFASLAATLGVPIIDADGGVLHAMVAIRAALESIEGGAVVVVDAADELDPASATLVLQLAEGGRVVLLVLARSDRPEADAVSALWREGLVAPLPLGALTRTGVETLLVRELGGLVHPRAVHDIASLSRGNPALVRELAVDGLVTGAITRVDDRWRRARDASMSSRMADRVVERLGSLSPDVAEVLHALCITDGLAVDVLERIVAHETVAALEAGGLVTLVRDGRRQTAKLVDPLVRAAVRAQLDDRERRRLALAVIGHLQSVGGRRADDPLVLGRWVVESGLELAPYAGLLAEASAVAGNAGDWDEAELLAESSLGLEDSPSAAMALAAARSGLGAPAEAVVLLEPLLASHETARGLMDAIRAQLALGRGDAAEAVAIVEVAHASGVRGTAAWRLACETACTALLSLGRVSDAIAITDRVGGAARFEALLAAGRLDDADVLAQRTAGQDERLGHLALVRGDLATACRLLDDALEQAASERSVTMISGLLAQAAGQLGRPIASEADAVDGGDSLPAAGYQRILGAAWAAAARGAVAEAQAIALVAADDAASRGCVLAQSRALHEACRLGAPPLRLAARLGVLAQAVDSPWVQLWADHAAALADDDPHRLAEIAVRLREAGTDLLAAEASAEASARFLAAGASKDSAAAAVLAHHLAALCGGADTPALQTAPPPPRLTTKELEVVRLAAAGLSNRAIAERLVVSIRTVEGHLLRAYSKLGTSDRAALPLLFGPRDA